MTHEALISALRTCATWEAAAERLGAAEDDVRSAARRLLAERVPPDSGEISGAGGSVRIVRDAWGIPSIFGETEADAWLGLGFAMAQDRLWQMDYLRRLGSGRLAEILGPGQLDSDRLHRALSIRSVAEEVVRAYTPEARERVEAFCRGINLSLTQQLESGLPFEFELLEYQPEPWTMVDTETIVRAFWWQLTGRFFFICVPEFARRTLGDGALFEAFLTPEGSATTIWPAGLPYPDLPRWNGGSSGPVLQDTGVTGSNNWAVGAGRSTSGAPILASDPHVPLVLPSVWYEARLKGGDLDISGGFAGGTAILFFGRNADVVWGLTNNISSLRDLYVEVTEDFDSDCYRRGEHWKQITSRRETIAVKGAAPVEVVVREVDHGPIISEFLPVWARTDETVSVRWVGHIPTQETGAILKGCLARTSEEFRQALREWSCPTFNFIYADRAGDIGYQLTGRIPLRKHTASGYRPGEDPEHAWQGFIPWEGLPHFANPPGGWLGSANNPVVTDEWPYPLSGYWPSDYRMQRLNELYDNDLPISPQDMAAGQFDARSDRPRDWVGPTVRALRAAGVTDPLLEELAVWDFVYSIDSRPACVFEAFFLAWDRLVLNRRFPENMAQELLMISAGFVERLLLEDHGGWFGSEAERVGAIEAAWSRALASLEARLGADRAAWTWGAVHQVVMPHAAASTPLLKSLLELPPMPNHGTWNSLNNSPWGTVRPFETGSGVSYRLLVDLAGESLGIIPGGQSGHPGSPHYTDQVQDWRDGRYRSIALTEPFDGPTWVLKP